LAFLPFVSFLFQCCFDTSTAVVELVSDGAVTATNTRNKGPGALINRTVAGAQAAGRFNKEVVEPGTRRAARSFAKGAYNAARASVDPEFAVQQIRDSKSFGVVKGGIQKAENVAQINARRVDRAGAAAVRARDAAQGASQAAVSNFAARSEAFNKGVAERAKGLNATVAQRLNPGGARRAAAAALSAQRRAGVSGDGSADNPYTSASAAGWDDGAGDWSDAEGPLLKPSAQQRRATQQRRDGAGARTGAIAGAVDALGAFGQRVLRLGVAPRPRPPESPESP